MVPAVVTAGEPFPVVYRATPKSGVRNETTFATKSKEGKIGQGKIVSETITASRWIHRAVIQEAGYYLLSFEFKNHGERMLGATARTKVRPKSEMDALFTAKAWDLPRGSLYFSDSNAASWNAAPPTQRDIIAFERPGFAPMLEQVDYDTTWWPLSAWNELHETLQPDWVPPLSRITTRFSNWGTIRNPVAYASWSQGGFNFLLQSEIGKQSWFYIEAANGQALPDLSSIFGSPLVQSPLARKGAQEDTKSFSVRVLTRFRATAPDAPLQETKFWLVHIRSGEQLSLRFPGYTAPERPRLQIKSP